jgi:predicted ATP-dependent serine protease
MVSPIIYLATEESGEQVHERCIRLGCNASKVLIGHPITPEHIETLIQSIPPELPSLIVLDSLQGLIGKDYGMGEDVLKMLKGFAVDICPVIVTNQITKGDDFAGPMANQHAVDGTFTFDRLDGATIFLETIKNRNGPAGVRNLFTMTSKGLIPHVGQSAPWSAKG